MHKPTIDMQIECIYKVQVPGVPMRSPPCNNEYNILLRWRECIEERKRETERTTIWDDFVKGQNQRTGLTLS